MDIDDGYILWTGIWKGARLSLLTISIQLFTPSRQPALGNSKGEHDPISPRALRAANLTSKPTADIVKMIDSQPDLAPVIRRVRGGYLKIQGTWMPYEVSHTRFLFTAVLKRF